LFANNEILSAVSTEFERKEYFAKMNYCQNTWQGAQCNRIGWIGLGRPWACQRLKYASENLQANDLAHVALRRIT